MKGLTKIEMRLKKRWERGVPHEPEALLIAKALQKYLPAWDIKFGRDGDSGEALASGLSLWIEDGKPNLVPDYYKET